MPTTQQTAESFEKNFMTKTVYKDVSSHYGAVGQTRDLLVIVDSSGSVAYNEFADAKSQLAKLVGLLCPHPDPFEKAHKLALLRFATSVSEIFDFNKYPNTAGVKSGIASMIYTGGSTCTASAFKYARETMFTAAKGKLNDFVMFRLQMILTVYSRYV